MRNSQIIEVVVSPSGQSKIETKGFAGADCRAASKFLEQALGQCSGEELTSAFYADASTRQTLREEA